MSAVGTMRCAEGRHEWVAITGFGKSGMHVERCRECGARGIWVSAAKLWSDAE